jgi:hypothetical protein
VTPAQEPINMFDFQAPPDTWWSRSTSHSPKIELQWDLGPACLQRQPEGHSKGSIYSRRQSHCQ